MRAARLLPLVSLLCGGCSSVSIHDLALSSIHVVDAHDQAEIGTPEDTLRRGIARMVGDPGILKDPSLARIRPPGDDDSERMHELLIKAEFTSRIDLSKIKYSDDLGPEIFFCHRPDAHTLIGMPYVYSNGHVVPEGDVQPLRTPDNSVQDALFKYYVFFRVFRDELGRISKPPLESFNLRSNPEDVCFKLVGGAYRAFGYSSNTVVVPSTMITDALRNPPAPAAR